MRQYIDESLLNNNFKTDPDKIAHFKELDIKLKKDQMNINIFRDTLADHYNLYNETVYVLRNEFTLKPFKN